MQAKLQCRTAAGSKVGEGRSIGSYADLISDKVCRRLLDAVFGPDSDASGPKIWRLFRKLFHNDDYYDSDVRLIWRQQFRERVAQFQLVKRLLQHRKTLVAVWQAILVIAGRKDEGYAARGERVGDGVTLLPVEIDIEHRGVDGLGVEHRQSLIDVGGGADDRAA